MVLIDTKDLTTANANISQILKELRLSNPKNVLLLCLNAKCRCENHKAKCRCVIHCYLLQKLK